MTKDDQLYAVIWLVRPVFRALVAAADDRLSGNGLGVPERGVLECLSVIGPLTVPSLARTIGVPRQFEQRTCNGLLASGLAERREPSARSVRLIGLTPPDVQACSALRARETAASKPLAGALSTTDLAAATRVLQAMRDHHERLPKLCQ